jgi:hypothetical protein
MDTNPTTVGDLEHELENALDHVRELDESGKLPRELRPLLLLAPVEGSSVHVSLRHRDMGRQIRRGFGAQAFTQRDGAVWIVFEAPHPDQGESRGRSDEPRRGTPDPRDEQNPRDEFNPFDEFIRALNEAEHQPQLNFVSLKWFRDTYLMRSGYGWAQDPDIPRRILQEATERSLVLTSKVPNPKQPTFPVTSIHLNRQHPDVQRILGTSESRAGESRMGESRTSAE